MRRSCTKAQRRMLLTLADRLNQSITEQKITKAEFVHRLGVTENYICILTGNRLLINRVLAAQ